ncbi:MAG: tRNA lysidine(34) synthetase TilS [Rudaea sp.]
MSQAAIGSTIDNALCMLPPGAIAVAFSGGMDSSCLLHALAANVGVRARGLRALHVDHGLNADSAAWATHCQTVAAALGVPITTLRVAVDRAQGAGIEAAARSARMSAFARELRVGEIVALAQHRDDQAETVLLKLLRGAGPEGLAGMRELREFAPGWLWRPLLALPRAALQGYARTAQIAWIEDPSNSQTHLQRNFLRAEILPRLRARWPDIDQPLAHSANWLRAAADFIDAQAQIALGSLQGLDPHTLNWRGWLALPDALRDPVLRLWLRGLRLDEPAHVHVAELERQLRDARADRLPCIAFARTELRRYRDLLYALRPCAALPADWQVLWDGSAPLPLPGGGSLRVEPAQMFASPLRVSGRRGGERVKPAGKPHSRELRLLLQEIGVPPWVRATLPLVHGDELLAVADLILGDAGEAFCRAASLRFVWTPASPAD